MKRREFIGKVGVGLAAAGALTPSRASAAEKTFTWKLCTSWPPKYPILQEGTERLAKNIETMSGGRLKFQVFAGGELIGPFDVFDAVSQGKVVQAASAALYYFAGKVPEAQFFSDTPFGFIGREKSAWFYCGGALELLQEVLKPFNMLGLPMINTGTQMGGWFRKEIRSVADLKGLRMRIPGLGGKVMAKAGANVVGGPGAEIFTNLERGVVDAAEWVAPLYDKMLGLHQAAKYYYGPAWHEPGTFAHFLVNAKAWEELPPDLKAIVEAACVESLNWTLARGDAQNAQVMKEFVEQHGVIMKQFPDDVLKELRKLSVEVLEEECQKHPSMRKVYDHFLKFKAEIDPWMDVSERAYVRALSL
jgi:TRAP-type mannitol/chloroaromatic compound transport system substrate-binding protein